MLLILFKIGDHQYGLQTDHVVEIIPALDLRSLPGVPDYVSGVIEYRGDIVPVIDISVLTIKQSSRKRLSTRIILLEFPYKEGSSLLGLMAEGMTDTLEVNPEDMLETGLHPQDAPHLGMLIKSENDYIQCVDIDKLLPQEIQHSLFNNKNLLGSKSSSNPSNAS